MKSRKKLIIALSSLCFVLVASVVTVAIVLAAVNQTINTSVSVVYKSKQVAGSVSAQYQVLTEEVKDMTVDGTASGAKTITYNGSEDVQTDTLKPQDAVITLTAEKTSVTFTYKFKNTGSADYTATLKYTDDWTGESDQVHKKDGNVTMTYSENLVGDDVNGRTVTVGSNTEVTVTVTVAITNVALNSEFSGAFAWNLVGQEQA